MQPMPHQIMGYDRAITMFSPDGRLLQVEYAKKTVRQGSTAIGIVCKDGVVLVTDKRIVDPLVVPEAVEKIFQIDDHICTTAAGILSDATCFS
jgi:proteasome alpha subunit